MFRGFPMRPKNGEAKLTANARADIIEWYRQRRTAPHGFLVGPENTFGAVHQASTLHDVALLYAVSDQSIDEVIARAKRLGDLPVGRLPRAGKGVCA
jgi:hypothetical protein